MKKITAALLFIFCSTSLYAQQPADSVAFPPPVNAPAKSPSSLSKFEIVAEVTTNGLSSLPAGVNNNIIGGLGLAFNAERKVFIVKNNFYFSFGLGIATYDYATNAYIETPYSTGIPYNSFTQFIPIPASVKYSKNKLNLVWLQVPLEFNVQTNKSVKGNYFDFGLGARLGYLINAHTKQTGTDTSGNAYKIKVYEIPNLEQFSTMITAKITYSHFSLFGYYNVLPLFVVTDPEKVYEWGAGLGLSF